MSTKRVYTKLIVIISSNERLGYVDDVELELDSTFNKPGQPIRVIFAYRKGLQNDSEIEGLPAGFELSYGTNLPVGDIVYLGVYNNPETGEEMKPVLLRIDEKKSWNDWENCVKGSSHAHFLSQISRMRQYPEADLAVVVSGMPQDHIVISRYTELKPFITKQLQLSEDYDQDGEQKYRDAGIRVYHCYGEALVSYYVSRVCEFYLSGHFSLKSKANNTTTDPEVLAMITESRKITDPKKFLHGVAGKLNGIGEVLGGVIAEKYGTLGNFMKYALGENSLDFLTDINGIGKIKRAGAHKLIFGDKLMEHTRVINGGGKVTKKRQQQKKQTNKKGKEKVAIEEEETDIEQQRHEDSDDNDDWGIRVSCD